MTTSRRQSAAPLLTAVLLLVLPIVWVVAIGLLLWRSRRVRRGAAAGVPARQ